MTRAKAKTIKLLLSEGTLKGVIRMEDSSWNAGELFSAPRESVDSLIKSDACKKFGVYLLLSSDMVYVGQSSDLTKRIKQHLLGKDWWERVVVLTTSSDSLTRTDIDYLESVLIAKALESKKLDCDNKNKGNNPKIDIFRQVELDQYIDEALFMLELIGITVFTNDTKEESGKKTIISSVVKTSGKNKEIRAKKEAKEFLEENGLQVGKKYNYAKLQEPDNGPNAFWMNPRVEVLEEEWMFILNNQIKHELIAVKVPAKTLPQELNKAGCFYVRKDKPYYLDVNIEEESLVDRRSKFDFTKYIIKRIMY